MVPHLPTPFPLELPNRNSNPNLLPLSLSPSKILIPRTPVPRHVANIVILQHGQHLVRQRADDLDGVDAWLVRAEALPLGDPRRGRVRDGDQRVKDRRRAFRDRVRRIRQLQEGLAVRAAESDEFLRRWGLVSGEILKGVEKGEWYEQYGF